MLYLNLSADDPATNSQCSCVILELNKWLVVFPTSACMRESCMHARMNAKATAHVLATQTLLHLMETNAGNIQKELL